MEEDIATHRRSRWFAYISSIQVGGNDHAESLLRRWLESEAFRAGFVGMNQPISMISAKNLDFHDRCASLSGSGHPHENFLRSMKFSICQIELS
jgi:hypothetical protein